VLLPPVKMSSNETFACDGCGELVPAANKLMHAIQCEKHSRPIASEQDTHGEDGDSNGVSIEAAVTAAKAPAEITPFERNISPDMPTAARADSGETESIKATCEFCELQFPFPKYSEHCYACGNRTDVCESCMCYVRLCDFAAHRASGCAVGATVSTMPADGSGEHAPLLPPPSPEPYHRLRQMRLADQDIPRWAPVVVAAVGVGAVVAFKALMRRR
jgi:hypothetical protein